MKMRGKQREQKGWIAQRETLPSDGTPTTNTGTEICQGRVERFGAATALHCSAPQGAKGCAQHTQLPSAAQLQALRGEANYQDLSLHCESQESFPGILLRLHNNIPGTGNSQGRAQKAQPAAAAVPRPEPTHGCPWSCPIPAG